MLDLNPTIPLPTNPRFQNLTGLKFNRLTVITYAGQRGQNHRWHCECVGVEKEDGELISALEECSGKIKEHLNSYRLTAERSKE